MLIGYAGDSILMAIVPSLFVRHTVAESMKRDLGSVSEWCDPLEIKLNARKTETLVVYRSRTMHSVAPINYCRGTVLKESDDIDILGVTCDSKMAHENHL